MLRVLKKRVHRLSTENNYVSEPWTIPALLHTTSPASIWFHISSIILIRSICSPCSCPSCYPATVWAAAAAAASGPTLSSISASPLKASSCITDTCGSWTERSMSTWNDDVISSFILVVDGGEGGGWAGGKWSDLHLSLTTWSTSPLSDSTSVVMYSLLVSHNTQRSATCMWGKGPQWQTEGNYFAGDGRAEPLHLKTALWLARLLWCRSLAPEKPYFISHSHCFSILLKISP